MSASNKAKTRHIGGDTFHFLGITMETGRFEYPVMVHVKTEDGEKSAKAYVLYWSDDDCYLHECRDEQVETIATARKEDIYKTLRNSYSCPIRIGSARAEFWKAEFRYAEGDEPEDYGYEGGESYSEYRDRVEANQNLYDREQELRKFIRDDFSVGLSGNEEDRILITKLAEAVAEKWSSYCSYINSTSCFHND